MKKQNSKSYFPKYSILLVLSYPANTVTGLLTQKEQINMKQFVKRILKKNKKNKKNFKKIFKKKFKNIYNVN